MNWSMGLRVALAPLVLAAAACGGRQASYVAPVFGPELEYNADLQAHAAMPDGQRLPQVLVGVTYARGATTDWSVALRAGQCYAFGYAADGDVGRVTMYLTDPFNRRADSLRGRQEQGVFVYCARDSGIHRLQGKARGGAGHIVVVSYTAQPSSSWVNLPAYYSR